MSDFPPDRRVRDSGPPAGVPERRRPLFRYDHRITLGNIISTGTVVLTILGTAIGAIFAAGSYVQHLRDAVEIIQNTNERHEIDNDKHIQELLQKILDKK